MRRRAWRLTEHNIKASSIDLGFRLSFTSMLARCILGIGRRYAPTDFSVLTPLLHRLKVKELAEQKTSHDKGIEKKEMNTALARLCWGSHRNAGELYLCSRRPQACIRVLYVRISTETAFWHLSALLRHVSESSHYFCLCDCIVPFRLNPGLSSFFYRKRSRI